MSLPWLAMQFTAEMAWDRADFLVFGAMLVLACAGYEVVVRLISQRRWRALGAVALASVFLLVWLELAVGILDEPSTIVGGSSPHIRSASVERAPRNDRKSSDLEKEGVAIDAHPFPNLPRSRAGMELASDPFMATSVEEQRWLDRNGYPNELQWGVLAAASDEQLRAAVAAGDSVAKALLDYRRLIQGDTAAIDDLLTAGAGGSGFALELLSSSLARQGEDPVMGYAVSRVAEMRGNLRLAPARDVLFNIPLTQMQRMEGENEAFELYRRLLRLQRTLHGASSPPSDPRPIGD